MNEAPATIPPRRSCLTVPASSQRMLEKAPGAGAAEAVGKGAARLEGEMVDEAMAVAARRLLARSGGTP